MLDDLKQLVERSKRGQVESLRQIEEAAEAIRVGGLAFDYSGHRFFADGDECHWEVEFGTYAPALKLMGGFGHAVRGRLNINWRELKPFDAILAARELPRFLEAYRRKAAEILDPPVNNDPKTDAGVKTTRFFHWTV